LVLSTNLHFITESWHNKTSCYPYHSKGISAYASTPSPVLISTTVHINSVTSTPPSQQHIAYMLLMYINIYMDIFSQFNCYLKAFRLSLPKTLWNSTCSFVISIAVVC